MKLLNEVYVSVDVETDGPIPGPNSMLSIGAAAFYPDRREWAQVPFKVDRRVQSTFSANLETLPGAMGDPDTMQWWQGQPEAWKACRENLRDPAEAMKAFVEWVGNLPGIEHGKDGKVKNAVFVGYPTGFDFTFVYQYLIRFVGWSPFSFSALDIKTFAMALLGEPFRHTTKRNMPQRWFPEKKHNHVAVDDAIEQGLLFMAMLDEWGKKF